MFDASRHAPWSLWLVGGAWAVVPPVAVACAAVPLGFLTDRWRDTAILIANLLQLALPAALVVELVLIVAALLSGVWPVVRARWSAWRSLLLVFGSPVAVVTLAGLLVAVLVGFVNLAALTGPLP